MWGYAYENGPMQYPGPTLIINQGDIITIYLRNQLEVPVSIIFPGQEGVETIGGTPGLLTAEAPPYKEPGRMRSLEDRKIPFPVSFIRNQEDDDRKISPVYQRKSPQGLEGWVGYTFKASHAGTYLYHSGTRPDLQVEMGLVGAIIVRPNDFDPKHPQAYEHEGASYNHEYLFLLTEIDPRIHELTQCGNMEKIDFTTYWPVYWFINGRNSPDTMAPAFVSRLPHQPYNCMPRMHPGDKLLMRVIGAGRDLHPFHHHGNHSKIIARDGRLLSSKPDAGPDLQQVVFTIPSVPGQTIDAIFEWTGKKLGWDIYGHSAKDPLEPHEYAPDHGKPFPVVLPEQQDLAIGAMYSGSPFLGAMGALPPNVIRSFF